MKIKGIETMEFDSEIDTENTAPQRFDYAEVTWKDLGALLNSSRNYKDANVEQLNHLKKRYVRYCCYLFSFHISLKFAYELLFKYLIVGK